MVEPSKAVMRCHEIQTTLGSYEVPEFETIPELGMATRLALHIRGLPLVKYDTLKLVANHFLNIPNLAVERVVAKVRSVWRWMIFNPSVSFIQLSSGLRIVASPPITDRQPPHSTDRYAPLPQ